MALFGGERGDCPHCGTVVRFHQEFSSKVTQTDTGERIADVLITVCPECQHLVVFVIREIGDFDRYPFSRPVEIPGTPARVSEAFREAQLALSALAPHAAATMLRRAVASAATDFSVPDKDATGRYMGLRSRIDALKDRLLPATYEAAQITRILGDGGAHEESEDALQGLGPIDIPTVTAAKDVVAYILSNLYELPGKVQKLRGIAP